MTEDMQLAVEAGINARSIRLTASRIEALAKKWKGDAGISPMDMTRIQRELGNIRGVLDVMFAALGKEDR
jgi:hypothetical protein